MLGRRNRCLDSVKGLSGKFFLLGHIRLSVRISLPLGKVPLERIAIEEIKLTICLSPALE